MGSGSAVERSSVALACIGFDDARHDVSLDELLLLLAGGLAEQTAVRCLVIVLVEKCEQPRLHVVQQCHRAEVVRRKAWRGSA